MLYTRKQFQAWGAQGGAKAALGMTKRQRKVRAQNAAKVRHAKAKLRNGA